MAETLKLTPGKGLAIKYIGAFDFDKLYKDMHDWFIANRYEFSEKEHSRKEKDTGYFIEVHWEGERKIDEYAKFVINVDISISEMNKVDQMDYGKMYISFSGALVLDYLNKWSAKPFSNFLLKVYNKYIIKDKINKYYFGKLFGDVTALHDLAKATLGLYS